MEESFVKIRTDVLKERLTVARTDLKSRLPKWEEEMWELWLESINKNRQTRRLFRPRKLPVLTLEQLKEKTPIHWEKVKDQENFAGLPKYNRRADEHPAFIESGPSVSHSSIPGSIEQLMRNSSDGVVLMCQSDIRKLERYERECKNPERKIYYSRYLTL